MRAALAIAASLLACTKNGTPFGSAPDAGGTLSPGIDAGVQLPAAGPASVLQHHDDARRSGVYTDASFTRAAVRAMRQDTSFSAPLQGGVYAQPLYWDAGPGGQDLLVVATQRNELIAFDPTSGARIWSRTVAAPARLSELPCGNIDPLGIIGTPVIDATRGILFADAMVSGARHLLYAVSLADGSVLGTPTELNAAVPGFLSSVQNQRGALALVDGIVYVPYSGHFGDCGQYAGWVVGIDTTGSKAPAAYHTGHGGGIWSMGGVAEMNGSLYVATGNTIQLTSWNGGEAILKLAKGPSFSGASTDFYAAPEWQSLDASDTDIGTAGALPFDVGSAHYVATLGKDGKLYLADRDNMGGIGGGLIATKVANTEIVTAPTAIATPSGTILAFPGRSTTTSASCASGTGFIALRVSAGTPPGVALAWCGAASGLGAPIATTTGSGAESIIWQMGAQGDGQLHAFDAEAGTVLYASTALGPVTRFNAPIVAKGRLYVAGNEAVYAFTVH